LSIAEASGTPLQDELMESFELDSMWLFRILFTVEQVKKRK
jgi:hypothetical protein